MEIISTVCKESNRDLFINYLKQLENVNIFTKYLSRPITIETPLIFIEIFHRKSMENEIANCFKEIVNNVILKYDIMSYFINYFDYDIDDNLIVKIQQKLWNLSRLSNDQRDKIRELEVYKNYKRTRTMKMSSIINELKTFEQTEVVVFYINTFHLWLELGNFISSRRFMYFRNNTDIMFIRWYLMLLIKKVISEILNHL